MKLSCLPVSLFDEIIKGRISLSDWAKIAKKSGYDAIDLSILFLKDVDDHMQLARIRDEIEANDIDVAMLTTYPDFTHPSESERQNQKELEKKYISAAKAMGAKAVRITCGQAHPGLNVEEGIQRSLEGIFDCVKQAEKYNITLLIENHGKPGIWEYPDFDQATDVFLRIADAIKNSSIKINFDTANPVVGGIDVEELLNLVIEQVAWLHAADTDDSANLHHVLLGTGLVPFDRVFKRLKAFGYDSWISVEEGSGLGEKGIASAAEFVRRMWGSS